MNWSDWYINISFWIEWIINIKITTNHYVNSSGAQIVNINSFIDNIIPDPNILNIGRNKNYKELSVNEENFYKIIDHIINKNKLKLLKQKEQQDNINVDSIYPNEDQSIPTFKDRLNQIDMNILIIMRMQQWKYY